MAADAPTKVARRQERIVELVREQERVTVEALASALGVSRETVRRDLGELAEQGRVRKVHRGAVLPDAHREGAFAARLTQALPEKRAAAQAAAALFQGGETLFIDTGSITLLLAEEFASRPGLIVITNGPAIAHTLAQGGIQVFLLGGEYRADTGETVGALTAAQIRGFFAGHAVIAAGGVSEAGVMDFQLEEAEVARAMIAQAAEVTVIADSSKLGRRGLFKVCALHDLDRLVVDRAPSPELGHALAAAGVEVIVAGEAR